MNKWLGGKSLGSNDDVIAETNGYFEELPKSFLGRNPKITKTFDFFRNFQAKIFLVVMVLLIVLNFPKPI